MELPIPEEMLITSFVYLEHQGENSPTQDVEYGEPIGITRARIDDSAVFSRDSTQSKVVADAVIFCYADYTTPFPAFKEQSVIIYRNKELVIKKVVEVLDVEVERVWSYELEVL